MDLSWLLPYLLFLHVLGAIVAFGPTFTFPFIGAMGGGEPQHANFATRVSNTLAHRLVYPIGITLPITGAAMMFVRGFNPSDRAFWWLGLAIIIYVIAFGYAYFFQRRLVGQVIAMTSAPPPPPGASGPPPELRALVSRIQRGGMATTVLLVTIIFLMVVKPTV